MIAHWASYLNQSWLKLQRNQCHYAMKLWEIIALLKETSLIPLEEQGLQISYSSSFYLASHQCAATIPGLSGRIWPPDYKNCWSGISLTLSSCRYLPCDVNDMLHIPLTGSKFLMLSFLHESLEKIFQIIYTRLCNKDNEIRKKQFFPFKFPFKSYSLCVVVGGGTIIITSYNCLTSRHCQRPAFFNYMRT